MARARWALAGREPRRRWCAPAAVLLWNEHGGHDLRKPYSSDGLRAMRALGATGKSRGNGKAKEALIAVRARQDGPDPDRPAVWCAHGVSCGNRWLLQADCGFCHRCGEISPAWVTAEKVYLHILLARRATSQRRSLPGTFEVQSWHCSRSTYGRCIQPPRRFLRTASVSISDAEINDPVANAPQF